MKFKVSILNFLMLAALSFVPLHIAYSQTASILPPAKTTYLDKNGKPLAFGTVDFYIPGTTTPKTTWQDAGQTIPNTNPVVLDNAGRSIVLGDGSYRQIVRDKNGNLIWDQVTSSTGSGGGGGGTPTVGDGDPVGIIKTWSGFVAPYQYVFAYGQELTRASYPEAFQAVTNLQNVSCTTGSATLTGIGDTSQLPLGANIESACLNAGATIVSKTVNTVVASSTAIISTTSTARFFPYGNGNGTTTFNLPDLRGRGIAGRDNMGGIAANRLPSPYNSLGGAGGNTTQTLTVSNLPPYTPSGSIANGAITTSLSGGYVVGNSSTGVQGGGTIPNSVVGVGSIGVSSSQAASTFAGVAQGGTSTPVSIIQPTQAYNYIIKVIPDTNPNSYFGVASIGGMYGVIECGFGITCAGNTISAINSILPTPTPTNLGGIFQSNAPPNQFAIGLDLNGNILYGGGATTVNGQLCIIGGSCVITAAAGSIAVGTTAIVSGNYNGLLYRDASGILASTSAANNNVVITDGSGVPGLSSTLPTVNLPALTGDVASSAGSNNISINSNAVINSKLAQSGAATFKGNPTASTANPQDFTLQGLTNLASPNATLDLIPIYDHTTGTIKNVTPSAISSGGVLPSINNKQVLANTSGSTNVPVGTDATTWFDSAYCNTVGYIIARTTGGWSCSQGMPVNVNWFGADPTGTVDSYAAFSSAISACPTCEIYVPQGTYLLSGNVTLNSRQVLRCASMIGTVLKGTGATTQKIIYINAVDTVRVTNCGIQSSVSQISGGAGIYVDNSHQVMIDHVRMDGANLHNGIQLEATTSGVQFLYKVFTFEINGPNGCGIAIGQNTLAGLQDVSIVEGSIYGAGCGINIASVRGLFLSNLDIGSNIEQGVLINPGNGQSAGAIFANNVYLDTNGYEGLLACPSGTGVVKQNNFVSLWSSQNGRTAPGRPGLNLQGTGCGGASGSIDGNQFTAPTIIGNGKHGIEIGSGVVNTNITGAMVQNNGSNGTSYGVDITPGVQKFYIDGQFGTGGTFGSVFPQTCGVNVNIGPSDHYMIKAYGTGNTLNTVCDNGSGTNKNVIAVN